MKQKKEWRGWESLSTPRYVGRLAICAAAGAVLATLLAVLGWFEGDVVSAWIKTWVLGTFMAIGFTLLREL